MNTNKILLAGLVGAVVAFLLGWLFYGIVCADFFANNMGSATGVMRSDEEMLFIPLILGHVAWGMLIAIIFGRWASISTAATGAKAGAVIGLLMALTYDLIGYGTTHVMTTTGLVADVVIMTVMSAITGAAVGWFLGRD